MKSPTSLFSSTCLLAITFVSFTADSAPALAQSAGTVSQEQVKPVEDAELLAEGAIIVQGERLRGQLQVEQAPVLELDAEDIEGIGANSIAELLSVISPQTGSSRGRGSGGPPAILVNGIRVSSFRELRNYPPEAIQKVEVMPEEVAQRFGFPPDRRVVNIILKEDYSSREIEIEYEGPSDGGYVAREANFSLLKIDQGSRFNVGAEIRDTSLLTESERDVDQTDGSLSDLAGDPNPAAYRSLVPDQLQGEASINWNSSNLDTGTQISLNGTYERDERTSLSGLNSVRLTDGIGNTAFRTFGANTPLERRSNTDTLSFGSTYSRRLGAFDLTATADASRTWSETEIDRRFDAQALVDAAAAGTLALDGALPTSADAGFDVARNKTFSSANKLTLRGNPLLLPAGEVSTTFDFGFDWRRIESDDTRTALETKLTRRRLDGGVNIGIPIAESGGAWGAIGDVTLNLSGGFEDLSDFGTLNDASAGVTWGVSDSLTLSGTYIYTEVPPSLTQLGSPQVESFNVPVFDFVTGESVLATVTSGGNPDLAAETQKDWKFSANWELPFWESTRFSVDYVRNRSSDVSSGFPALTGAIEAAFPDRVTRDTAGQLLAIDQRPVTFARTRSERLVFSLTTRGSFGAARPRGEGGSGDSGRGFSRGRGGPAVEAGNDRPAGTGQGGAGTRGPGAGGPPSDEQRAAFMAFRERICAADGMEVLTRFAETAINGGDLLAEFPNFDAERAARMVERFKAEDGSIDPERLSAFRERICSMDPAEMRGPGGAPGTGRGRPDGEAGGPPAATNGGSQPGGERSGPPSGRFTRGFGGSGQGRYFVNLTHNIELDSTILIAPGVPELDQLDGDTIGSVGFARHTSSLEGGLFKDGKGLRVSGRYTGKARVTGSGVPGSSDLYFGDLATIDLRVFFNLGQVLKQEDTFLNNVRLSLRADNIFNAKRDVRDANGDVPTAFQPDLIDPTGRFVGIDIRKMF